MGFLKNNALAMGKNWWDGPGKIDRNTAQPYFLTLFSSVELICQYTWADRVYFGTELAPSKLKIKRK